MVLEWSRTSWLQDATDIPWKRLASPLAMAELRGDNQMEWAVTPDELRPVTIDDVISPVPMNPIRMSLSCRFQMKARKDLQRYFNRVHTEFVSILSDDGGTGWHFANRRQTGSHPRNRSSTKLARLVWTSRPCVIILVAGRMAVGWPICGYQSAPGQQAILSEWTGLISLLDLRTTCGIRHSRLK
jgi:hypothetical protein